MIVSDDREIVKIFRNATKYSFSYEFEQTINDALYSMAVYGQAYIFVKPEYVKKLRKTENLMTYLMHCILWK